MGFANRKATLLAKHRNLWTGLGASNESLFANGDILMTLWHVKTTNTSKKCLKTESNILL